MRSSASLAMAIDSQMHVEELAPDVHPAGGLDDTVSGKQLVKAGIAVGMDDAAELLQVGPRVCVLPIWRVEEQRCRSAGPANGRSLDQGVHRCGAPAAVVGAGEQIILVADCDRAERSLGRIVVERGADPLLR